MLGVDPGDNARLIAPLFRASRGFWITIAILLAIVGVGVVVYSATTNPGPGRDRFAAAKLLGPLHGQLHLLDRGEYGRHPGLGVTLSAQCRLATTDHPHCRDGHGVWPSSLPPCRSYLTWVVRTERCCSCNMVDCSHPSCGT